MTRRKIVVGVSGASGAPYAKRLLTHLGKRARELDDIEVAVCLSATAPEVWRLECGFDVRDDVDFRIWEKSDYRAPFASGSAGWHAMVVIPCSMGTVGRIAHGISDNLLTRAADVMLKERRTLILVPRETPLGVIHLENLLLVARAGAVVLPAMPSFYRCPTTIDDVVDSIVGRILDHLGLDHSVCKRWGDAT